MTNELWNASGWDAKWQEQFEQQIDGDPTVDIAAGRPDPGRIVAVFGAEHLVATPAGERRAVESGQHRYLTELGTEPPPVIGDFVVLAGAATSDGEAADRSRRRVITGVLPRRSLFARKRPGVSGSQPLVANLDLLVIVTDPLGDFSIPRVVRYVEALRTGCDAPVLLAVNKADTVADAEARAAEARGAIPGIDACAVSALRGDGLGELRDRLAVGSTVALAGSSGVGKSTLVNALCRAQAGTAGLRGDGRGRHTTTARRAYLTTDGALLIDTPGMREIGVYSEDADGGTGFADIEELAERCRFRDCRHEQEPGCAVLEAVDDGRLTRDRYESFLELRRETEITAAEHRERKRQWEKEISREVKRMRTHRHKR